MGKNITLGVDEHSFRGRHLVLTLIKMMKRVSFGFRNINNDIAKMTLAFRLILWLIHRTN